MRYSKMCVITASICAIAQFLSLDVITEIYLMLLSAMFACTAIICAVIEDININVKTEITRTFTEDKEESDNKPE